MPKTNINCILNLHMKIDPLLPTHFSSGTRRDRSPLLPAAMNATVCSLPLAVQLHARQVLVKYKCGINHAKNILVTWL